MFTGIIEKLAEVKERGVTNRGIRFKVAYQNSKDPVQLGESIAMNGVCLTVAECNKNFFSVEAVKETLLATTLGEIHKAVLVNLERSLKVGDRLGGHFVFGHVDGVGKLIEVVKSKDVHTMKVEFPKNCRRYLAQMGSVALDGVSLTIQRLENTAFTIAIVPHTAKLTSLGQKEKDDRVNIEVDMLARYVQASTVKTSEFPFAIDSLKEQGF